MEMQLRERYSWLGRCKNDHKNINGKYNKGLQT